MFHVEHHHSIYNLIMFQNNIKNSTQNNYVSRGTFLQGFLFNRAENARKFPWSSRFFIN